MLRHLTGMTNVLTLKLDEQSQAEFERARQKHFPAERNQIPAHLTLFHTLPDESWVYDRLSQVADAAREFAMEVTGVRSLGKGVAYKLAAGELQTIHAELTRAFAEELSPQDKQRFQPHVVVQNKVTPAAARELLDKLKAGFVPWKVRAYGLDLWHYRGGPWEHAATFRFHA